MLTRLSYLNTGSAKKLEGSIYVITFFVSETPWPMNKKMALLKQVLRAESWLEKKAKKYGKDVKFVNGLHGFYEPFEAEIVPDYDSGNPQWGIAQKYLRAAGYPADASYPRWVKEISGCDQSLIIVIANKYGRGYANAAYWETDDPEGAILYHSNKFKIGASNIIHEILHLFGAVDLYETKEQTAENSTWIEQMYPKEVMHNPYYPLKELVICPLTAWLVGLSDKKESWYENFISLR